MSVEKQRPRLGRGLSALFEDAEAFYATGETHCVDGAPITRVVPISWLHPGRFQPRHNFTDEALEELAQSIRGCGLLQPILVRSVKGSSEKFEIIAGERRWRASQLAQLHEVPVIVRQLTDGESLEIALVENLQRRDLSPLEEAVGYQRLIDEFGHTQNELADFIGKSRSQIANTLRLLGLPEPIKILIDNEELSVGHARALITAVDPLALARHVVERGLNVRQTEALAQAEKNGQKPGKARARAKDPDTCALENDLSERLGLTVSIEARGEAGRLIVAYRNLDQLDGLLDRLTH
ncbi:MAG: ParB/RepB/Spo0J family partition protein [Pseudomonadota bacterium]|nr:ParB/RepB/Spo0J family partition protein [Pseudomonadota bacterium]